jgi:hypothetical protein
MENLTLLREDGGSEEEIDRIVRLIAKALTEVRAERAKRESMRQGL